MIVEQPTRRNSILGGLGVLAIVGGALMFLARGHWVLWAIALVLTTVALGGIGYFIGKASA